MVANALQLNKGSIHIDQVRPGEPKSFALLDRYVLIC